MQTIIGRSLTWAAAAALIAACAPCAIAADADSSVPIQGKVVGETVSVTATVEAVDVAKRVVTLKDEDGHVKELHVGEEVRNLPQVKKGDQVVATYYEAVAYDVYKPGTAPASAEKAVVTDRAKLGEKPRGGVAQVEQVTAKITAIDSATSKVTLQGPEGNEVTVKVKDPKKLEGVSVGDEVQLTYTQALAISVKPAPAK